MSILNVAQFEEKPEPFEEGTTVIWTDPYISENLIKRYPDIDVVCRKEKHVNATIEWLSNQVETDNAKILDLGCGPGVYTERLAQSGHDVSGIDLSATLIDRARESATEKGLDIDYFCEDFLDFEYEEDYDLIMMIYCGFGTLSPAQQEVLLEKVYDALGPDGIFLFDALNDFTLEKLDFGKRWEVANGGFWREGPYVCLFESFHYSEIDAILEQHIVIEPGWEFEVYRDWNQYYEPSELESQFKNIGFSDVENYEHLLEDDRPFNDEGVTFYKAEKSV